MFHISRVSALLLLLIHFTALQLMGFPRRVLVERFTNTYSDQCAAAYPAFEEFFSLHADVLSIIEYHTWFPVNLDPWYQFAPIENRERADYYAVDRLPTVLFDGVVPVIAPNGQLQLESAFSERAGIESPVQMGLAIRGGDGSPILVDLTLRTADSAFTDYSLRTVLTEVQSFYEAPNGRSDWRNSFLAFSPNPDGISVSMDDYEERVFNNGEIVFPWYQRYDATRLKVTALLQNDLTHETVQAVSIFLLHDYEMQVEATTQSRLVDAGEIAECAVTLVNRGRLTDSYSLDGILSVPDNWIVTGQTDRGDFMDHLQVELTPGDSLRITVHFETSPEEITSGAYLLTISSMNRPQDSITTPVFVMTAPEVLLVDAAAGNDQNHSLERSLEFSSQLDDFDYRIWNIDEYPFPASDLQFIETEYLLWSTGQHGPLTAEDASELVQFIDSGGSLLVAGGNAADLIDGTTLGTRLGFSLIGETEFRRVQGVSGDEISDGLQFTISEWDGADDVLHPDVLSTTGDGIAFLRYDSLQSAAVRTEAGDGSGCILLGFPLESIVDSLSRNQLMSSMIRYGRRSYQDALLREDPDFPESIELSAFPNPMNHNTTIKMSFPGDTQASLLLYDRTGRLAKKILLKTLINAGSHSFSLNTTGLSSGIYFFQLDALMNSRSFRITRKLVVIK